MICKVINAVFFIWTAILILLILLLGAPRIAGLTPYAIVSGSMEPTIPIGSVVYADSNADITDLSTGDIIVFSVSSSDFPIVHRVENIDRDTSSIITKGDANASADPHKISARSVMGTIVFSIPIIGYIQIAFMQYPLLISLAIIGITIILYMSRTGLLPKKET